MRKIEEIKSDIAQASANGTQRHLDTDWLEWFRCVAQEIPPERLEEICNAERDNRCVVLPKEGDSVD